MKNKDDYFSENPGDSMPVDKSTQYVTDNLQTKNLGNQDSINLDDNTKETGPEPKLGDEQITDEDGHDYAG